MTDPTPEAVAKNDDEDLDRAYAVLVLISPYLRAGVTRGERASMAADMVANIASPLRRALAERESPAAQAEQDCWLPRIHQLEAAFAEREREIEQLKAERLDDIRKVRADEQEKRLALEAQLDAARCEVAEREREIERLQEIERLRAALARPCISCGYQPKSSAPRREAPMAKRLDPDIQALRKAVMWIERSTSERMKRATVEYLYDRYVRHPPLASIAQRLREGPHGGPSRG